MIATRRFLGRAMPAAAALMLAGAAAAEGFKPYPGAVKYTPPDTEETRQFNSALRPGTTISAYLTSDSFEQVVAFYKGIAREYTNARAQTASRLPDGREVKTAFLILDGATDLIRSRSWINIRYPFVASRQIKSSVPGASDVRDVTEIVLTEKKDIEKKDVKKPER
jgi:hypothetical protein